LMRMLSKNLDESIGMTADFDYAASSASRLDNRVRDTGLVCDD
jgi:hypothetical protein